MSNSITQGIILTGGSGSRLAPYTNFYSKALVGINGHFVIDYPLDTLRQLGVKDLIVVLGGSHFADLVSYIEDGKKLGFNSVAYVYQSSPSGISQAISLCEHLIDTEQFVVILGDNVFEGPITLDATQRYAAQIVLHKNNDLKRFGVASLDHHTENIIKIEEKPTILEDQYNQYAVSGLYQFDRSFFNFFRQTKPSARGEFEITSIIEKYLEDGSLGYTITDKMWIDAGTHDTIQFLNDYFSKGKL
jgi:glucose-1-phosphate thymidylyltransferase